MEEAEWPRAILVHSLDQALDAAAAAEALGSRLVLRSASGAGGNAGVGWFAALAERVAAQHQGLEIRFVLDCADEAGTVQGAIRRGIGFIRFSGPAEVAARLAAIAAAQGAEIDADERPVLDLLDLPDPASRCRAWLSPSGGGERQATYPEPPS
jgi:hypothetical protein